jgi:hypothetical protein
MLCRNLSEKDATASCDEVELEFFKPGSGAAATSAVTCDSGRTCEEPFPVEESSSSSLRSSV